VRQRYREHHPRVAYRPAWPVNVCPVVVPRTSCWPIARVGGGHCWS